MTSHPDFDEIRDITIIGAGPVGLSTAFWAGMREASSRIIDSLPELGGQLTTLYPEKWIFDVPGHTRILAKDLVNELREQALGQFDVPVHLETTAHEIAYEDDLVVLKTDKGDLRSRTVIIAGGHGAFEPKKLPVSDVDMTPWEGRGASYLVGEKSEFDGKRVVIVGGGDSAFDWVVNLLDTASEITLVHRRDGFRAHEATVSEVMEHVDSGRVDLKVPYVIKGVEGNGEIETVELHRADGETRGAPGLRRGAAAARLLHQARPAQGVGLRDPEGRADRRRADEDEPRPRVGVRRHHHLRRQAQADRHRLRGVRDRRLAGRPHDPAGHEDPARLLDEYGRAVRRRGPGLSLHALNI